MTKLKYEIAVKKLSQSAILPTKAHVSDVGWDLYSDENAVIYPESSVVISTGIAVALPNTYFAKIFDRSGNAANRGFHILAGVIDTDYTGEIKVVVFNYTNQPVHIRQGQKIAQMVLLPNIYSEIKMVDELPETERNIKGFGSSGE